MKLVVFIIEFYGAIGFQVHGEMAAPRQSTCFFFLWCKGVTGR